MDPDPPEDNTRKYSSELVKRALESVEPGKVKKRKLDNVVAEAPVDQPAVEGSRENEYVNNVVAEALVDQPAEEENREDENVDVDVEDESDESDDDENGEEYPEREEDNDADISNSYTTSYESSDSDRGSCNVADKDKVQKPNTRNKFPRPPRPPPADSDQGSCNA